MCADRWSECDHHVDEKEYLRGCNRAAYGRCPACQRRVCLQHLSEHHQIEIEPHFDILIDRANQIRQKLETMSIDGTKQRAQQFVEAWKRTLQSLLTNDRGRFHLDRTVASIERAAADKLMEIDLACAELTSEMSQFRLATLEKLKTDMLLAAPHIHRDYVHPDELARLEELLTIINSHIDRYSKHELLEEGTTSNTPPTTPKHEQNISSTLVFYHDHSFYH